MISISACALLSVSFLATSTQAAAIATPQFHSSDTWDGFDAWNRSMTEVAATMPENITMGWFALNEASLPPSSVPANTENPILTPRAASCHYNQNPSFASSSLDILATVLQDTQGSTTNNIPLKARSCTYFRQGGATLCVCNQYVWDNTHTSKWESGWGVRNIYNQCAKNWSNSQGGYTTGHGDTGLAIRIDARFDMNVFQYCYDLISG